MVNAEKMPDGSFSFNYIFMMQEFWCNNVPLEMTRTPIIGSLSSIEIKCGNPAYFATFDVVCQPQK